MHGTLSSFSINNYKINGPSGSNIKSIQRGEFTFADGAASRTLTISPVNTAKSIVLMSNTIVVGSTDSDCYKIVLTNATTVTFSRIVTTIGVDAVLGWEVIEFNNVKSLQTGALLLSTNPQNLTISNVNPLKSIAFASFTNPATTIYYMKVKTTITSGTVVKFEALNAATTNYNVAWQVIEFN